MPLPFSIFSNYRSGAADYSASSSAGDAVKVMQEWFEETVAKEAAAMAQTGALSSQVVPAVMETSPEPLKVSEPQPEVHGGGSLLFRDNALLSSHAPLPPRGEVKPMEELAQPSPFVAAPMASPNQRAASAPPGAAIAASLAIAAQQPEPRPSIVAKSQTSDEAWLPNQISSRELAQVRVEMRQEIEQVRGDLFGAAMGVSALKDRLDGLESQVVAQAMQAAAAEAAPSSNPGPSREEVQGWVHDWLQTHLDDAVQAAVQKFLENAAEHVTSTLSSSEFFRMPTRPPAGTPLPPLSQAPQILSSRPT